MDVEGLQVRHGESSLLGSGNSCIQLPSWKHVRAQCAGGQGEKGPM